MCHPGAQEIHSTWFSIKEDQESKLSLITMQFDATIAFASTFNVFRYPYDKHCFTLQLNQRWFHFSTNAWNKSKQPKEKEPKKIKWQLFKRPPCAIQGRKEGKEGERKILAPAVAGFTKDDGMPKFRATQFPISDDYDDMTHSDFTQGT